MTEAGPGRRRLYFGAELCERLLPDAEGWAAAVEAAREEGSGLTLVTPPVSDHGLRLLGERIAALDLRGDVEVVVNDWGTLELLRALRPRPRPVLGRLLDKTLRDPRVAPHLRDERAPAVSLRALRQSGPTSPPFRRLLAKLGVERVELDNVHQGIDVDFGALGLRPSIHVPFSVVTTGRPCLFAGLGREVPGRFTRFGLCGRQCRMYGAVMTGEGMPQDGGALIRRGNAVFYAQPHEMVRAALRWAEAHGARVVVHRDPLGPAGWATDEPAQAARWLEDRRDAPDLHA